MDAEGLDLDKIIEHRFRREEVLLLLRDLMHHNQDDFLSDVADILVKVTALLEVSSRVSETLSLELLLKRLSEVTTEALDAYRCTIFLNDRSKNELYSRSAVGNLLQEIRFPNHLGIAGAVFSSGKSIVIDDAYADPRFNPEMDRKTGYRTRNILAVPVRNRNREVVGVIQMLNKKSGHFTRRDLYLLEAMASHAAAAVQNALRYEQVGRMRREEAHLYEQVELARREESQLHEVTAAILGEVDRDMVAERIVEAVSLLLDAERSFVFLYNRHGDQLEPGSPGGSKVGNSHPVGYLGIARETISCGDAINIQDIYLDTRFFSEVMNVGTFRAKSILSVPFVDGDGQIIGVVQAVNKRRGPFTKIDEKRLKDLLPFAATALKKAYFVEELLTARVFHDDLLDHMPCGVLRLSCKGLVEKHNSTLLGIFALPPEPVTGRAIEELFAGNPSCVTGVVERVVRSRRPEIGLYAKLTLHNGQDLRANLTVLPVISVSGQIVGAGLVFEPLLSRYMGFTTAAGKPKRSGHDGPHSS